ncbi:hypothetical protein F7734_25150 [Scytonema sp. UIC 10036]|uniref:hypothetical protein n=1 Tax=Scytonema sp. UIC 10036 TaxID=2304196 RepID=UPI0012DA64D0|nr:hypothetical protein [Scytonema sp. UIC 10036]MUG95471.1 hypothetical protein [Scytonema sp. UIC 10036]
MSTSPAAISPLNKSKINISMMLNLPIDIELEVVGISPNQDQQIEDKENVSLDKKSECQVRVSGMNLSKIEDSQALLNQIVSQLQQENKIFSTRSQANFEENNIIEEKESLPQEHELTNTSSYFKDFAIIPTQAPLPQKKFKLRFSETLNDSLTFALNSVGAILFLGKLANYSWE